MKKLPRIFHIAVLCSFSVALFLTPAFAQNINGEIININAAQQIAFIDLGKDNIANGDVFAVETSSGTVYLEVVETAAAVSKLGIATKGAYKSTSLDFQNIGIGAIAKRVGAVDANAKAANAALPSGMPNIDPQMLVKPNIANETIQSLDTRMDKMVESNVKLFNTLTDVLNEKKKWQADSDQIRAELQSALDQIKALNVNNADLKKQIAEASSQTSTSVAENERNKKLLQESQAKLQAVKNRLDAINKTIQERLK